MDYLTVALAANLTSLVATGCLLALLAFQSIAQSWKRIVLVGVTGQFIWALSTLLSYSTQIDPTLHLYSEVLRFSLWLFCLFLLLTKRISLPSWPLSMKLAASTATLLIPFSLVVIHSAQSSVLLIRFGFVLLACAALIFTEQVVRNLNTHRMLKLLGLCLAFLFVYDVLAFGLDISLTSVSSLFIQGRSALAFTIAIALAMGALVFNDKSDAVAIFSVSRPAAFFSTAIVFSVVLLVLLSLANLFIKNQGFLGSYLFALALAAALFVFFALLVSKTLRQHAEVFLSKHFFSLKYDYRQEWLNALRKLSELQSAQTNYYDQILKILKDAMRAPAGSLWLKQGSELRMVAGDRPNDDNASAVQINEPFIRKMVKSSWIYVPNSPSTSLAENNELLPAWAKTDTSIWLISPLIIQMKFIGFVILNRPRVHTDVTFEDRDLMTNLSTQIASHILLQQQERVISDSKQLETYNRLSAFVMHDINNVIAQLSLIGKNADRHKSNPAFIDDMIKTVGNATQRMQSLVQKFNPGSKEKRETILVSQLISELEKTLGDTRPSLIVEITDDFSIEADKQRLALAIKNLVRNAQEVSPNEGSVILSAKQTAYGPSITISDDGPGMTQQFISEELFRPFSTTKEESGIGIGAYLTKSYLEHLGAALNVVSHIGKGSKFEILFP
ncbi:XrtA/PEP-CTERM system histidine kinase PrsK [Reinekea blandensis]|uniref:histidine kinase n=1 Tax=Reinekea blandensis MED297 TaxID=314283 RepID=A4B932_9GAMM|nr:XrtA/PEP-CTERM system histidine kinase PrsK [Reinekea blandensis]EAR11133.1 Sensory transduction histidine kinase [Reinekea sp. MED297] [Reinekea blandensis MED297]